MKDITRILAETTIRKYLKDIKLSPKRSIRNLVDTGFAVARGRFQTHLLEATQKMLQNENSPYYDLVIDTVYNVEAEKLITFGMNVGYNSCTKGARKICEIESTEKYNIPWSVSLEIDISHYLDNEEKYFAIIEQGKKLGIYTWLIFSDNIIPLLSLAKKYQDCAFIYFCEKKCIDDELINEADSLNNVMFAVRYNENMSNTVIKLRERQMLYSVYVPYTDENAEEIMSDDFYEGVQEVHPTFAALLPLKESTNTCRKQVHDFISACRSEQKMQTILWDVYSDGKFIDSVISDVACFAAFNKAGNFVSIDTDMENKEINIFERTLKDVFKTIFPKTE